MLTSNMKIYKPRILVIGVNSKLAQKFIRCYGNDYVTDVTVSNSNKKKDSKLNTYVLDLSKSISVTKLVKSLEIYKYDGILLFSSIYEKQEKFNKENFKKILNVNLLNVIQLLYGLKFNNNSKIIFFADNGTSQPKKNYLAYTLSKNMMEECIRFLAVEFSDSSSVIGIGLGPVLTNKKGIDAEKFYSKSLIKVDNPSLGLVNFINFILNEKNFYSTGAILNFDGGTYIKRSQK
jgi:hypothetical protein